MKGLAALALAAGLLGGMSEARAGVAEGQPAPAFTKNQLDSPGPNQTTPRTLADYSGKVIFLFMLGYNCPVCLSDGPSVEQDIHQYYAQNFPGQVAVVGADHYNGTAAQLRGFRTSTGATYPLLLQASIPAGGNMGALYGPNDVHVVINKQGIVRLNTLKYAHGSRYRLNEIRACIDSLIMMTAGVDESPIARGLALGAQPNPFRDEATIALANPGPAGARAVVTVHDMMGRNLATLLDGTAAQGTTLLRWNGRGRTGVAMPAGIYLVRARIGGAALSRRLVRVQ